jgi:hypothetical protein
VCTAKVATNDLADVKQQSSLREANPIDPDHLDESQLGLE